jgi:hypothetical protein
MARAYVLIDSALEMYSVDAYPIFAKDSLVFAIFSLVHFVVNYCLFLVFNTLVKVIIVVKLSREIREKRERMEALTTAANLAANRAKLEADEKRERKAIIMAIANGLVNLLLRFPEFFTFVVDSNLPKNALFVYFCDQLVICENLVTMAYFSYLLTCSTNCFIYYLFNTKFKESFQVVCHRARRRVNE